MTSNIQYITIHDDGLIEMTVICPECCHKNIHTITHALEKKNNKTVINFSKLGTRMCHNANKNKNGDLVCNVDYNLYMCK